MTSNRTVRVLRVAALVVAILVAWQLLETWIDQGRVAAGLTTTTVVVPTPTMIAQAVVDNFWIMQQAMLDTLTKAGLGFALGAGTAILVALCFALFSSVRAVVLPLAYAFNSFPIFGLVPVIVLAFGQDNLLSIAAIAAILSYFPILISLDSAFNRTTEEYLELGLIYNASRWQTLRYIKIPAALPGLFVGLRLAAPASIVGATIGELLGSSEGVGNLVAVTLYQLQPGLMYAMLIEVALVCGFIALAVTLIEKQFVKWS